MANFVCFDYFHKNRRFFDGSTPSTTLSEPVIVFYQFRTCLVKIYLFLTAPILNSPAAFRKL